ncbi:Na(+)-translocating NADH-quinone reductase subunit C [Desulfurivibrio sp. D14AmB]|uniref:Na(+)-translocating NADH-quinone reductase subunit C n=1 Tax=Desulfurivibrio sp. D14AmB TaxID=3374370 RepID=UPI00376EB856
MADRENSFRSFYTVLLLALVCSALVSGAAVGLRERQEANQRIDQQKNILQAAGIYQAGVDVEQLFAGVEARIIRLRDGSFVPPEKIDPGQFDQLKTALKPQTSRELSRQEDLAGLGRLEEYALIYLVRENGRLQKVVLPIRGRGAWSTMHGYVALAADLNTVAGATFYRHGETPGLGGEIENPGWLAAWRGKQVYDRRDQPALRVVKGDAPPGEEGRHQIDGISGATMTLKGVSNLLEFWFGEHGFKPFLERYREGGLDDE